MVDVLSTIQRIQTLNLPSEFEKENNRRVQEESFKNSKIRPLSRISKPEDIFKVFLILIHRWTNEENFAVAFQKNVLRVVEVDCDAVKIDDSVLLKEEEILIAMEEWYPGLEDYSKQFAQICQVGFTSSRGEFDGFWDLKRSIPIQIDLHLHFNEAKNEIHFVYSDELFTNIFMDQALDQFELILESDEKSFYDISLVTEEVAKMLPDPKEQLSNEWVGSVVEHFERNANAIPSKVSVQDSKEVLTFHQLNHIANQLAHKLQSLGLKKNDVVAIFGHRSSAIVWALLSVLKCGAAICFLDAAYPTKRIINCIKVAEPVGIIEFAESASLTEELKNFIDSDESTVKFNVVLSSPLHTYQENLLEEYSHENPGVEIFQDDVAVITFTSGSTGLPKGVLGRHGPLTHYYPWMKEKFQFSRNDRFSMTSGLSHDPLQRDVFTPFFLGCTIFVPDQEVIVNPGALAQWFRDSKITITCLTPAMGQLLTSGSGVSGAKAKSTEELLMLPDLRFAFFVGDVLTKKFVKRLSTISLNCRVINMYGSTETSRSVTYYIVPRPDAQERESEDGFLFSEVRSILPIGRGMKGAQSLIFARRTEKNMLAGIGEMGEIYMRSHHLSKGYKGKEEETAAKFLKSPYAKEESDRMYKTGDLGRYLRNGDAVCLGRADDQIKIRGFRIELGEINTTVNDHHLVKECVTIVRTDTSLNQEKRIVAYIVFESEVYKTDLDIAEVHNHLTGELKEYVRTKLPEYMVPSYFVPLMALPLTPNGKIMRNKLPKPEMSAHLDFVAPRNNLERELAAIWSGILDVKRIGIHDNFFDLGGHSVNASLVTFQIRGQVKGAESLPVELLFDAPSIGSLAAAIEAFRSGKTLQQVKSNVVDLNRETQLDPFIKPENPTPRDSEGNFVWQEHWGNPKNILLTGATGFLGTFLLGDLMKQTTATIHLVVRAKNIEDGLERIQTAFRARLFKVLDENDLKRIVIHVGDLSKRRLGLSEETFAELSNNMDMILHNGAMVHWMYPYHKLKAPNVNGTKEILKIACFGKRVTPVHYVSTTSVFDSPQYSKYSDVYEDSDLPYHEDLQGGYAQSKFVAERLVMAARKRGLPACLYRPGYITGASDSGVWTVDDFICRLIKGCVSMKSYPWINTKMDMSPVDFVSGAITYLSRQPNFLEHGAYHVVNPNEFNFHHLFRAATRIGYRLQELPLEDWKEILMTNCRERVQNGASDNSEEENPLFGLASYFNDDFGIEKKRPWYDNSNTLEGLEGSGISCPSVIELMGTYYKFLSLCGFLEPPEKPSNWAQRKLGFVKKSEWKTIKIDKSKMGNEKYTSLSPTTYESLTRNNRF